MTAVGIVGHEAAKFTTETEAVARAEIRRLIHGASLVVSGECHLGGVDIYAREEAEKAGIPFLPCPPATLSWETGYKPRNLKIARESDVVYSIVVRTVPETYRGMTFARGCYHCGTPPEHHVKSGGCWTLKQARRLGKSGDVIVI